MRGLKSIFHVQFATFINELAAGVKLKIETKEKVLLDGDCFLTKYNMQIR